MTDEILNQTPEPIQQVNPEIYGSPENYDYSSVELPEGMELDNDMISKFNPLAKKYNLSNASANELLHLAIEMQQRNMAKVNDLASQIQESERESYRQMLSLDKEFSNQSDEEYSRYLSTANIGLNNFATEEFKNLLIQKGLVNHPEFIRTFHRIGQYCISDALPKVSTPTPSKEIDPADILYGIPH